MAFWGLFGRRERVVITWSGWISEDSPLMGDFMCVYFYANAERTVYIGKADRSTVQQRHRSPEKHKVRARLECEGIDCARLGFKVGYIDLAPGTRLSQTLLGHVESLLIFREYARGGAVGNRTYTKSRPARPGMYIVNKGDHAPLLGRYDDEPA